MGSTGHHRHEAGIATEKPKPWSKKRKLATDVWYQMYQTVPRGHSSRVAKGLEALWTPDCLEVSDAAKK